MTPQSVAPDSNAVTLADGHVVRAGDRLPVTSCPDRELLVLQASGTAGLVYDVVRTGASPTPGVAPDGEFQTYRGHCRQPERYTLSAFMATRDAGLNAGPDVPADQQPAPPPTLPPIVRHGWATRGFAPGLDQEAVRAAGEQRLDPSHREFLTGTLAGFMQYAFASSYDVIGSHLAGRRPLSADDLREVLGMLAVGWAACGRLSVLAEAVRAAASEPPARFLTADTARLLKLAWDGPEPFTLSPETQPVTPQEVAPRYQTTAPDPVRIVDAKETL